MCKAVQGFKNRTLSIYLSRRNGSNAFPQKTDSVINVKVEFSEGEGKVPLDNIAKRAEAYKPKERVTYKRIKEYIEAKYGFKVRLQSTYRIHRRSKAGFRLADV